MHGIYKFTIRKNSGWTLKDWFKARLAWILAFGIWNDGGGWVDNANWID